MWLLTGGKPRVMRSSPSGRRYLHPTDGVSSQILSQHFRGCCVPYQRSVTVIQREMTQKQAIISCVGLEVSGPCSQLLLFSQNFKTGKVPQMCLRRHSSVHQPQHTNTVSFLCLSSCLLWRSSSVSLQRNRALWTPRAVPFALTWTFGDNACNFTPVWSIISLAAD